MENPEHSKSSPSTPPPMATIKTAAAAERKPTMVSSSSTNAAMASMPTTTTTTKSDSTFNSALASTAKTTKSSAEKLSSSSGSGSSPGVAGSGGSSRGDSKADTEDDDEHGLGEHDEDGGGGSGCAGGAEEEEEIEISGTPCECVQCEVCMAENWWRMAALHNSLLQQQQDTKSNCSPSYEVSESATTGLDLIGSAATLMLNQQQAAPVNGGPGVVPPTDEVLRADFSMPKLREFFECQKQMGIPNFPEDFDEFWLLVVKARLFNIFKYRGPEAYNRIVLKIRDIARQFRAQMEERERQEAAAAAMAAIVAGKEPKEALGEAEKKEKGTTASKGGKQAQQKKANS